MNFQFSINDPLQGIYMPKPPITRYEQTPRFAKDTEEYFTYARTEYEMTHRCKRKVIYLDKVLEGGTNPIFTDYGVQFADYTKKETTWKVLERPKPVHFRSGYPSY
jgi:hypothetical protein